MFYFQSRYALEGRHVPDLREAEVERGQVLEVLEGRHIADIRFAEVERGQVLDRAPLGDFA